MSHVALCTHLRAFHAWSRSGIRSIDLSLLPSTVKLIQLESVHFKLSTLHRLACTRAVHAKLNCYSDSSYDVWRLMQLLPDLQVLTVKGFPGHSKRAAHLKTVQTVARLSALTSLSLYFLDLKTPSTLEELPRELQSLHLDAVCLSTEHLDSLLRGALHLSSLRICDANIYLPEGWQPRLPRSLRHLELMNWSPLDLPQIPLESFSWCPSMRGRLNSKAERYAEMQSIAALSSLTKLDLSSMRCLREVRPLRHLPLLRELSIAAEYGVEKDLIAPEALPSLEKLYIDSTRDERLYEELETWTLQKVSKCNGKTAKTWTRPRF